MQSAPHPDKYLNRIFYFESFENSRFVNRRRMQKHSQDTHKLLLQETFRSQWKFQLLGGHKANHKEHTPFGMTGVAGGSEFYDRTLCADCLIARTQRTLAHTMRVLSRTNEVLLECRRAMPTNFIYSSFIFQSNLMSSSFCAISS